MGVLKKVLVGILALTILFGATACTKKPENTLKTSGTKEVVWYYPGNRQEDQQLVYDVINEKLAKYGLKVKFELVDQGAYNEKMNLLISSGGNYDICFTSSWSNNFRNNLSRGAFLSLNDLLNSEAKKLKESLPDYIWNGVSDKGKIYGIPNNQVLFNQPALYMTKEMAQKYNVDPAKIKDYKDIEPILEKIKNGEPGKFPGKFDRPQYEMNYEMLNDVVCVKKDISKESIKAYFTKGLSEEKAFAITKKSWYDKGYIRKDILTVTNDAADLQNLKYGIWTGVYKPGTEAENQLKFGKEIFVIKFGTPYLPSNAGQATINAISAKSKVPNEAIKVLEIFNTDKEIYNLIAFGIEGKHYTKISENKIKLSDDKKYQPNDAWKYGNQFNAFYTQNQSEGIWEETDKMNNEAQKSPIAGFVLNTDNIKNEMSQISAVIKEYGYLFLGAGYSENKYKEYLEKVEQSGISKVLEETEKQLKEFFNNKK